MKTRLKRDFIKEMKDLLFRGTTEQQVAWQSDPDVIAWCERNADLCKTIVKEVNETINARKSGRPTSYQGNGAPTKIQHSTVRPAGRR